MRVNMRDMLIYYDDLLRIMRVLNVIELEDEEELAYEVEIEDFRIEMESSYYYHG